MGNDDYCVAGSIKEFTGTNTTSVVFSINEKSELIKTLGDKKVLEKYLSKNFEFIKNIKVFSDVESYDLKFQFLNSTFKNNEIYVGDIAHRIHPIAGQGWNMTVRDINNLTKIYKSKIKYGYKLNDYSILKEFDNTQYLLNIELKCYSISRLETYSNILILFFIHFKTNTLSFLILSLADSKALSAFLTAISTKD